jgi:hypothetical protein
LRPQLTLRGLSRRRLAAALTLTLLAAFAAQLATAASAQDPPPVIRVADSTLRYGQVTAVRGHAGRERAGSAVTLEYRGRSGHWRALRSTRVRQDGRFGYRVRLHGSGALRAVLGAATTSTRAAGARTAPVRSATARVAVTARLGVGARRLDVLAGRPAAVTGTLRPARRGRTVRLQVRKPGRWATVAIDRTDSRGRYRLAYAPRRTGSSVLRVVFGGDRGNTRVARRAGRLNAYRRAAASWYALYGGALACGGRLGPRTLGVAHKTLPCGTRVTLRYRGRSVRVPVVDRGPYAGGRIYDLTGATAKRLRFSGTGTVWATR